MSLIEDKLLQATKDILEKNMTINEKPYSENEVILVYDLESPLSKLVSNAYIENFKNVE